MMEPLTREQVEETGARAALCAEATLPGKYLRALVQVALKHFEVPTNCLLSRQQYVARSYVVCSEYQGSGLFHDAIEDMSRNDAALRAQLAAMTERETEVKRLLVSRIEGYESLESSFNSCADALREAQQEIERLKSGTVTVEDHNRIVGQTITAMDAERTSFEREIERLRAALEVLANLGGRTSTGNQIAQQALAGTKEGG